ncbi:hypothetical protein HPP92_028052, partial [Vanilla planifolia]
LRDFTIRGKSTTSSALAIYSASRRLPFPAPLRLPSGRSRNLYTLKPLLLCRSPPPQAYRVPPDHPSRVPAVTFPDRKPRLSPGKVTSDPSSFSSHRGCRWGEVDEYRPDDPSHHLGPDLPLPASNGAGDELRFRYQESLTMCLDPRPERPLTTGNAARVQEPRFPMVLVASTRREEERHRLSCSNARMGSLPRHGQSVPMTEVTMLLLGFCVCFEDDSVESAKIVKQWNVKIISVSIWSSTLSFIILKKNKRHQDRQLHLRNGQSETIDRAATVDKKQEEREPKGLSMLQAPGKEVANAWFTRCRAARLLSQGTSRGNEPELGDGIHLRSMRLEVVESRLPCIQGRGIGLCCSSPGCSPAQLTTATQARL